MRKPPASRPPPSRPPPSRPPPSRPPPSRPPPWRGPRSPRKRSFELGWKSPSAMAAHLNSQAQVCPMAGGQGQHHCSRWCSGLPCRASTSRGMGLGPSASSSWR
ncbi:MAG: hypothetical protein FJ076_04905 [Cyanobacteria bacterium K_DeepCast_35m_m1_288]|nr:hypothetical protein [Cyanobacteria bacterium K_DeepCast_35m_m1_288]